MKLKLCTIGQAKTEFDADSNSPQENESTHRSILGVRPDFSSRNRTILKEAREINAKMVLGGQTLE